MSYEDQTNDDLRTELERRELSTSGNKDDLVARLELDDAERSGESSPEGDENPPVQSAQPAEGGSTVQGRPVGKRTTAREVTGVPVQKRDENQDASVRGRVTNERGDVIG